jgi:hypothetical protein
MVSTIAGITYIGPFMMNHMASFDEGENIGAIFWALPTFSCI